MQRCFQISLAALALGALALSGCGHDASAAHAGGGMQAMPVAVQSLAAQPVEDAATYVAMLKSRHSSSVMPQVEGQITKILVKSGDHVAAGATLMQIDPLKQEASTDSQQAALRSKQADTAYAEVQLNRIRQLFKDGVASRQDFDEAQRTYDADLASVNSLQAQLQAEQVQLRYYRVAAPTAGIVGDVPVHVGDRVTVSTMLTTVDQPGALEAYVYVPVERTPQLKLDERVQILDEQNRLLGEGRTSFISPQVDPATQTILVKALIPNPSGMLRTQESVRARVIFGVHSGLVVPVLDVTRINGQAFVFLAAPGEHGMAAHQIQVQLGEIQGNNYVVEGGLKAGDQLITSGLAMLADGMPVKPMG